MRKTLFVLAIICVLCAIATADRPVASSHQLLNQKNAVPSFPSKAAKIPTAAKPAAIRDFGRVPIYFTPNAGQMSGLVKFYVTGKDKTVYFTPKGVTYALSYGPNPSPKDVHESMKMGGHEFGPAEKAGKGKNVPGESKRWAVKMDFVGANPDVKPQGLDKTGAAISYFKGKPEEWKAGLPAYSRIIYKDLWPGIDLVFQGQRDKLKYEFIVHPGADPAAIELGWRGAEKIRLDDTGRLEIETPVGSFVDETPSAYQEAGGRKTGIAMGYDLRESPAPADRSAEQITTPTYSCGFKVGAYDKTRDLILDPATIVYCGYIGGADVDRGWDIAVDTSGNAYVTGSTSSDETTFPATVGPDLTFKGFTDVFVAKIKADGSGLAYCGYIGGSEQDEGYGIAVDGSGNAYVTGFTNSDQTTFPVTVGPDLTYHGAWFDGDAFVAKVNASGTALIYCGYIGGDDYDVGEDIAVDTAGNAYVIGNTSSDQGTFPISVGPDLTFNDGSVAGGVPGDAFVAKVNALGTALDYCGYIGGFGGDFGSGIAVDGLGNAYVTGYTQSDQTSFPVTVGPDLTYNSIDVWFGFNAFVAKVNASGTALDYCGYIGGFGGDFGSGIAVDGSGNAYVTGVTNSDESTFPLTVGPNLSLSGSAAFMAKINASQMLLPRSQMTGKNQGMAGIAQGWGFVAKVKPTGIALVYCGYLSGGGADGGSGIAVDSSGNAYVSGVNILGEIIDARVTKINASGTAFVYHFNIGGGDVDSGSGIAVDSSGNAYVTGLTSSDQSTFPVTVGPSLIYNGNDDAFIAKITWSPDDADIAVTKTADNLAPKIGETFNYTVTVTNSGPQGATGLKVTDSLPTGLTYVSSAASKGTYTSVTGIWDIGALANGGTAILTIGARGTSSGFVTNTASVSALNETDPNLSNNSASASVTVKNTYRLTITAGTGGTTNPAPGTYTYDEGTVVNVTATAATNYRFLGWSGDASGSANPITITMNANKTVTANFIRRYTLTITAGAGGTTSPVPGIYTYDEGTSVSVQAVPAAAYQLDSWTGDASGSANTVTIVMNGNKAVQANFTRVVKAPLVLTGEKLINRNVSMIEYVARLRWQPNPANTGTITYRIYQIENGQASVIANVGAGTYEYIVRGLLATKAYLFGVTAVNSQGWESDMVQIAIM